MVYNELIERNEASYNVAEIGVLVVGVDCFRFELEIMSRINEWYLFSISQMIICQDELIRAENIPSRHDNKQ